jgi:hypothetical protein
MTELVYRVDKNLAMAGSSSARSRPFELSSWYVFLRPKPCLVVEENLLRGVLHVD